MPTIDRIGRLKQPLVVTCLSCRRQAVWQPREARRRLGGDCTTTEARRRLKCSACGERRSSHVSFSTAGGADLRAHAVDGATVGR